MRGKIRIDLYSFGWDMPGRSVTPTDAYTYGMNGQIKDKEVFDGFTSAEFWGYDSRLGRRWEMDPLAYSSQSPYVCFNNNPIYFSDPEGLKGKKPKPNEEGHIYNCENGEQEVFHNGEYVPRNIVVNFFYDAFANDPNSRNMYLKNKAVESKTYKVFTVGSFDESAKMLLKLKETYNVTTVYYSSHGRDSYSPMEGAITGGGSSFPTFDNGPYLYGKKATNEAAKIFRNIGNAMDPDGNIVLMSCGGGETNSEGYSVIGNIAKHSRRTVYGNRGMTIPGEIPNSAIQATYGTLDEFHVKNFPNLMENAGEWNVAKPALNTAKGYELQTIPAPIISPQGIKMSPYHWKLKNYFKLKFFLETLTNLPWIHLLKD